MVSAVCVWGGGGEKSEKGDKKRERFIHFTRTWGTSELTGHSKEITEERRPGSVQIHYPVF